MKINFFQYLTLFFIVTSSFYGFSQTQIEHQHLVDSILVATEKLPTTLEKVKILTGNAGKYRYTDFSKAFIDKSIEISTQENNPLAMAHSYYSLGNYFYFRSKLDTAKVLFNKAENLISNIHSPSLKSLILTSKSGIQKKEGDYFMAISTLFKAKEILESIDTTTLTANEKYNRLGRKSVINNSLATIYTQLEDYESAIYYYELAYNTSLKLKNLVSAGIILSNKGELLVKMKRYDEALEAQKKGKALKIKGHAPQRSLAFSNLNIGIVLSQMEQFPEAMNNLNQALSIFEKADYIEGKMNTLTSRGDLFIKTHQYDKAIQDCEKAKSIAFKIKDTELQKQACDCLYRGYKAKGNTKLALANHELFLETKEKILNEKNIKKMTQLEMQFDFDKKEEMLDVANQAKAKENRIIIRSLIGGIAALLLIALLFFRLFRIRKKTSMNLQRKNLQIEKALTEKEVLLKEIHHRVKNNLQIISSLLSMQGRQIDDKLAKQAINDVKNRVKAMALIHQNLYQNDNLTGVDAQDYIDKLTHSLIVNYNTSANNIEVTSDIDPLKLDFETIIPFGLIINELVTNSLKYAFPPDTSDGKIHIILKKQKYGLILEVADNGVGLPQDFEIEKTSSLGFKLIQAFSKKLKAVLNIDKTKHGTTVRLEIPDYKK